MEIKKTEGLRFDPKESDLYFLAIDPVSQKCIADHLRPNYKYLLVALNELTDSNVNGIIELVDENDARLILDSGIFNLTMTHAREHGVKMEDALALAPQEIDGFDELHDRYLAYVDKLRPYLWGYIELDQGGRENKKKTRAKLEKEGLRPIPVFHPLNDGWDYFDYLAERYNRICVGNLVKAPPTYRRQLLYEIHRRWQNYPDLWIHALGVSPGNLCNTFRPSSCDSTSWFAMTKYRQVGYSYTLERKVDWKPNNIPMPSAKNRQQFFGLEASAALLHNRSRQAHHSSQDQLFKP